MRYLLILIVMLVGCAGINPFLPEDKMPTYKWPVIIGTASTERVYGADYNIIQAIPATEILQVAGNQVAIFAPGVTFEVNGSTGNDGDWVVLNSAFFLGNTNITVTGDITDATADGVITPYTFLAADKVDIIFYDTVGATFVRTNVLTDALLDQWLPQRNAIGYRTNGKWGFAIVDTDGHIRYYENADVDWTAAGAWAITAECGIENDSIDIQTRQNWIWLVASFANCGVLYLDLTQGAPAWASLTAPVFGITNKQFSFTLDDNLYGVLHLAYFVGANLTYRPVSVGDIFLSTSNVTQGDYPQIVVDFEDRLWVFYTYNNELWAQTSLNQPAAPVWNPQSTNAIYSGVGVVLDHKIAHNPVDDTIHIVLCDYNAAGDSYLIYLRRDRNHWTTVTLKTYATSEGDEPHPIWPQISLDSEGSICIYFIYREAITGVRNLLQLLLPGDDYDGFATPANWDESVVVDDVAVKWDQAIGNDPSKE